MLTLISVANPWMFGSPASALEISHSVAGFPVRAFSQTIGFDPGAQAPNAETLGRRATRLESATTTEAKRINRLRHPPEGRLYLGRRTVRASLRRTTVAAQASNLPPHRTSRTAARPPPARAGRRPRARRSAETSPVLAGLVSASGQGRVAMTPGPAPASASATGRTSGISPLATHARPTS